MTINSTTRRWSGLALKSVGTCAIAASALVALATPAGAHTPKVNASCEDGTTTLTVELKNYVRKHDNTVRVTDGDTVLDDATFGADYRESWEVPGDVDHEFVIDVAAWDDPEGKKGWSFVKKLSVAACVTPTTTEPPSSTTKPTTPTEPTSSEPPSSSEPTPTEPTPTTTTEPPAPAPQGSGGPGELAETGASIGIPLTIGALLVLGGGGVLFMLRRRSKA